MIRQRVGVRVKMVGGVGVVVANKNHCISCIVTNDKVNSQK